MRFAFLLMSCLFSFAANSAVITTVPSWDGVTEIGNIEAGPTSASGSIGQSFTLTEGAKLDNFTFFMNDQMDPDFLNFRAYVYRWSDTSSGSGNVVGDSLFESNSLATSNNGGADGFEAFTIDTSGLVLEAGMYIAFFSVVAEDNGNDSSATFGRVFDDPYLGGNLIFNNHAKTADMFASTTWYKFGSHDLAFTIQTSAVPVPAAVWLFGSALAGLGWVRRKRSP